MMSKFAALFGAELIGPHMVTIFLNPCHAANIRVTRETRPSARDDDYRNSRVAPFLGIRMDALNHYPVCVCLYIYIIKRGTIAVD